MRIRECVRELASAGALSSAGREAAPDRLYGLANSDRPPRFRESWNPHPKSPSGRTDRFFRAPVGYSRKECFCNTSEVLFRGNRAPRRLQRPRRRTMPSATKASAVVILWVSKRWIAGYPNSAQLGGAAIPARPFLFLHFLAQSTIRDLSAPHNQRGMFIAVRRLVVNHFSIRNRRFV